MTNAKIQIYDDYCKTTSKEEISAILDRISIILAASYNKPVVTDEQDNTEESA